MIYGQVATSYIYFLLLKQKIRKHELVFKSFKTVC